MSDETVIYASYVAVSRRVAGKNVLAAVSVAISSLKSIKRVILARRVAEAGAITRKYVPYPRPRSIADSGPHTEKQVRVSGTANTQNAAAANLRTSRQESARRAWHLALASRIVPL